MCLNFFIIQTWTRQRTCKSLREITLMWILLWQNWCSRLLRARNVMKQRHDMEWHSHKRTTQSLYRVFLGGPRLGGYQKRFMKSAGGRLEKLVHYLLFPFLLCLGFVFTTLHFTTRLWAYLNSQIRISIPAILFLLIIIHSCIPALGWPKTAQSVHCCSRSAILLRFCLKTYKT